MTSSASTFLIPGEDASWRVWKARASGPSEAVDSPADYGGGAKSVLVGLPASACRTVGLVLPNADSSVLAEMVASQLERRGIKGANGEPPVFRHYVLGHAGPNVIVSVDVLAVNCVCCSAWCAPLRSILFPGGSSLSTLWAARLLKVLVQVRICHRTTCCVPCLAKCCCAQ